MTPFSFDKNITDVVKGIAILMMVWLHTFGVASRMDMYTSIMHLSGGNIEYLFAKACNPVGLFMVISGYGLYLSFIKNECGSGSLITQVRLTTRRILRIYIPWWITLSFGVPVLFYAGLVTNPFSWQDLIGHITAWSVSWNGVGWYILPFVLISYLLNLIFPSFKRHSSIWLLFGFVSYFGINKIYGMCWDFLLEHHGLKILCSLFEFLFPMLLGAFAAKHRDFELNINMSDRLVSLLCHLGIVLMFAISVYQHAIPMYPIYCFILVLLIVNAHFPNIVYRALKVLGQHSLNIWFIHHYLIPFAYRLSYSPIVYVAVVFCSLLLSYLINKISQPIVACIDMPTVSHSH